LACVKIAQDLTEVPILYPKGISFVAPKGHNKVKDKAFPLNSALYCRVLNKKDNNNFAYLIALAFSVSPHFASANEELTEPSSYFLGEVPTVLSANRLATPQLEAPAAITVIDKQLIEASGAKEITDLFRLVPGMQVGHYSGHFPIVSYHGMSDIFSRRMQVLIDGSSVYLPSSGGVSWSDLPWQIEDIERIEVIRGPAAATYGPNSFLGVINIITTHASKDQGTTLKATGGERGYRRTQLRNSSSNGKLDYRVNLTYLEDDGLPHAYDSQRTNSLNSRLDYQLTQDDTLLLNFGYNEGPRDYLSADASQERKSFYSSLKWMHNTSPSENFYLNLMYSYNRVDNQFTRIIAPGITSYTNNDQRAERLDLEFQHTLPIASDIRLMWGAGLREDRAMAPLWLNSKQSKASYLQRLFANAEWHLSEKLILNIGALIEHNSLTGTDFSPRVALNYIFLPNHSLRIVASSSTRTPTITEEHLDFTLKTNTGSIPHTISNGCLDSEESNYFELGYHGQTQNNRLSGDLKLYRQSFDNLISSKPTSFPLVVDNRDSANNKGVEAEINYRPSHQTLFHGGFSHIDIDSQSANPDYNHSAPTTDFNLLASTTFRNSWRISGAFYFRNEMEWLRSENRLGRYRRFDLTLAKTVRLSNKEKISIALTLQTALDKNETFVADNHEDNRGFVEISYHVQ
jgi:iron complex outermembrane receptor protein